MADRYEGKANEDVKRYDVPGFPGAWVELRRWTHGESNRRTDGAMSLVVGDADNPEVVISTAKSRRFDFRTCILDHNIDFGGKPADFRNDKHVDGLDPNLGEAIADLISEHNTVLEDDDIPKSS